MGDAMIYICAKCKFLFERKNDPSKCPSCECQSVMDANKNKRQMFIDLRSNQREVENCSTQAPTNGDKPK